MSTLRLFLALSVLFISGCFSSDDKPKVFIEGPSQVSTWEDFSLSFSSSSETDFTSVTWTNELTGETFAVETLNVSALKLTEDTVVPFSLRVIQDSHTIDKSYEVMVTYDPNLAFQQGDILDPTMTAVETIYALPFIADEIVTLTADRHFSTLTEIKCEELSDLDAICIHVSDADNSGDLSSGDVINAFYNIEWGPNYLAPSGHQVLLTLTEYDSAKRSFKTELTLEDTTLQHSTLSGRFAIEHTHPTEENNFQRAFAIETLGTVRNVYEHLDAKGVTELSDFQLQKDIKLPEAAYTLSFKGDIVDVTTDAHFHLTTPIDWQASCSDSSIPHRLTMTNLVDPIDVLNVSITGSSLETEQTSHNGKVLNGSDFFVTQAYRQCMQTNTRSNYASTQDDVYGDSPIKLIGFYNIEEEIRRPGIIYLVFSEEVGGFKRPPFLEARGHLRNYPDVAIHGNLVELTPTNALQVYRRNYLIQDMFSVYDKNGETMKLAGYSPRNVALWRRIEPQINTDSYWTYNGESEATLDASKSVLNLGSELHVEWRDTNNIGLQFSDSNSLKTNVIIPSQINANVAAEAVLWNELGDKIVERFELKYLPTGGDIIGFDNSRYFKIYHDLNEPVYTRFESEVSAEISLGGPLVETGSETIYVKVSQLDHSGNLNTYDLPFVIHNSVPFELNTHYRLSDQRSWDDNNILGLRQAWEKINLACQPDQEVDVVYEIIELETEAPTSLSNPTQKVERLAINFTKECHYQVDDVSVQTITGVIRINSSVPITSNE